jgi:hypothetical protein
MTSIQGQLLKLYFKLHLMISPFPKTLDINKERAEMNAMAKLFKPLAEIKCTPADIPGIPAEWITPPIVEKVAASYTCTVDISSPGRSHRTGTWRAALPMLPEQKH